VAWSKPVQLLIAWGVALLLSGLLVLAGERWPEPLEIRPLVLWSLVLGPPALLAVWLASRWGRCGGGEGQSTNGTDEQA
jgi:peptidoglycan/LPS O-acetylase OafA/YrhL